MRLFDTRNSQSDVRRFLGLPPKSYDPIVDKKWTRVMDEVTDAYSRAHFDTSASWRFVSASDKDAVTYATLSKFRAEGTCEWDLGKLEQVVLWRLQILHKRERDQWWQERKRRGSKQDSSTLSSYPSSEASSEGSVASPAASPTKTIRSLPRPSATTYMYDPVREAASCH